MATYEDFWGKAGPGMLDVGVGMYTRRQAQNEAEQRLRDARGPLYDQATAGATGMLTAAGNFDPQAFAADRFKTQQALVAPVQEKSFDDFYRKLYAKGQLGMGTYNPGVEGVTPNGMLMNPQLTAFLAAQNAQRSKDAYGALGEGQKYLDSTLNRADLLARTAGNAQATGLEGQRTQPSRAAGTAELLRGVSGVLKDSGVLPGMFKTGMNWLGDIGRNFWNPVVDVGGYGMFDW